MDLEAKLGELVEEALELRFSASLPPPGSTPQAVLDSLLDLRGKADRLEALNVEIVQMRAKAARTVAAIKAEHDDSWAEALSQAKKASSRAGDAFEGPRERYAAADLATLTAKRKVRKAEELLSTVDEASDLIRVALRGLNEVRQDHKTWLSSLQLLSYLEK